MPGLKQKIFLQLLKYVKAVDFGTKELSDETIREYLVHNSPKYLAMVDEIRKSLNLTTLKFQSLEKLIAAIGLPAEKVCTYCWTGKE